MEQKTQNTKLAVFIIGALLLGGFGGYAIASNTQMERSDTMSANTHMMPDGSMMDNTSANMPDMSMAGMMETMNDDLGTKTGEEFEIAFLEGMIEHHIGAVDMAELVLKNTERPELVKLANEIIAAQKGEIELMREWRSTWYN